MFGCLNHEVPLTSSDNASVTCETGRLGCACPPPDMSGKRLGGRWQRPWGHLALEPGTGCSVPVPALPRRRGCPLPYSPGALHAHRVPGRLPALRQCHGHPQPPANPLPPDRQLVPEPALTLCHRPWVRASGCPLPVHPEGISQLCPASMCTMGACVCLSPVPCVTTLMCARGFAGCVSPCKCLLGHGWLYFVPA